MRELIRRVLVSKKARNTEAMNAFVRTASNVGQPWSEPKKF